MLHKPNFLSLSETCFTFREAKNSLISQRVLRWVIELRTLGLGEEGCSEGLGLGNGAGPKAIQEKEGGKWAFRDEKSAKATTVPREVGGRQGEMAL